MEGRTTNDHPQIREKTCVSTVTFLPGGVRHAALPSTSCCLWSAEDAAQELRPRCLEIHRGLRWGDLSEEVRISSLGDSSVQVPGLLSCMMLFRALAEGWHEFALEDTDRNLREACYGVLVELSCWMDISSIITPLEEPQRKEVRQRRYSCDGRWM